MNKKSIILILSFTILCKTFYGQTANTLPSTGAVGIGTTSPSAALAVLGVANQYACDVKPLFEIDGVQSNTCLKDLALIRSWAGILGPIRTDFIVKNTGNIGIGLASPTEKLDVAGNIRINDYNIYFRTDNNHGLGWFGSSKLFAAKAIDGPVLFGYAGGGLGTVQGTTQNIAVRWNSAGQVIIGNQSPIGSYSGFKLSVDGDIVGKRVVAQTTQWADRVFSKTYNLIPLTEIENYIEINNHLPEIPSECEVLENGVNLGEMNVLLLQKIEELTLHLIEQEKRIKSLENQTKN